MYVSYGSLGAEAYDADKALIEDSKVVVMQAADVLNNPKMKACPAAAAVLPRLQSARDALDSSLRFDPPDIGQVRTLRDPVTALIREAANALAACQGKAAPYKTGGEGAAGQAGPGSSKAQVLAWQEFLVSKGCNPGTCDGLWGPATAAATSAYNAGKCSGTPGKCVYPKEGAPSGGQPPAPPPVTPGPPTSPGAPPEKRGEVTKEFIAGVPNSALLVGGLAIAVLGVAVVVKKRGMPSLGGGRGFSMGAFDEDYGPHSRTEPMSRTRRSATSTRRSATTRRRGR